MVGSFEEGTVREKIALLTMLALVAVAPASQALGPFVEFETGQVRPLALSPDGTRLFAINTPDNRLEIFDVDMSGNLSHAESVPVGMEPVAVAARTNAEVWVVNHLSDSVSIVDVGTSPAHVTRTLLVGDEPRDIVFAGPGGNRALITTAHRGQNSGVPISDFRTAGIGRADVWVFDATNLGTALGGMPMTVIQLFGDTPRALAASPDGSTVYAAVFHSGNRTTTIGGGVVCDGGNTAGPCSTPGGEGAPGGLPSPGIRNCANELQPEVGLIVRFNPSTGDWEDELGRDWSALVKFNLPDEDVFLIDANAATPAETGTPYSSVGTILFNMAVNPVSGKVYVSNTEARNEVRFEGPGSCSTTVQGHLHEARVSVLDGGAVTSRHLNKHINYNVLPAPLGVKQNSLATPTGMAVSPDGNTLYVAAFGSQKVGFFSTATLENDTFTPDVSNHIALSAGGPSGMVLSGNRLYVLTRFDNGISTIDTGTKTEIAHTTLFNPEPATVLDGRPFLYDANISSSNGEASCSSCHVFGDFDSLAWDLGNPDDTEVTSPIPSRLPIGDPDFFPMKGPMTTQSLRGMANHGAMHWRGDRSVGQFGTDAFDEELSFNNFIVAFPGLLGRDGQISATDMQKFTDFMLDVVYPPNPNRNLDNSDTANMTSGRTVYNTVTSDTVNTCNGCHVLNPGAGFFGTDGFATFENETQHFKIAHLRNIYQKIGMFGFPDSPFVISGDNGHKGDQIRGFGMLHDGSIDTAFRFLRATVFNALNNTQRRNLEELIFAFPTTLAPIVGQQITLTSTNAGTVGARISLMIQRAQTLYPLFQHPGARECDLIVKGVVAGEQRGWRMSSVSGAFVSDRATDPTLTDGQLRALAATPGQELTYTCAPPGSGVRMGIDRDLDGTLDGDETGGTTTTTTVSSSTTTTTSTTIPGPGCAASPAGGCRTPAKAILVVKNSTTDAKDKLVWKFLKGPATVAADFGSPTTTDDYNLCFYDDGGTLVAAATAPAGGTCGSADCWRDLGANGFKYVDKETTPNGVQKIILKPGDTGRSKVLVKGKGANLSLLPLPVASFPLTVQLQGEHGECWDGSFDALDVRANDASIFKAKASVP